MKAVVTDNVQRSRYELPLEGAVAFINYRRSAGVVTMLHAEVPPAFEGRGIGSALVKGALDLARSEGSRVVPACSFVRAYIERHRDYQDLLESVNKP